MVGTLTDLRSEIADALEVAGLKSAGYFAETIQPPLVVVVPGEPYLTAGKTFGSHDVRLDLLLVGGKGTNKASAANLDTMIETVIATLKDWDVADVTQPGQVTLNGSGYLGTVISIQTQVKFD